MTDLKKELLHLKDQLKIKMDNFMSRPMLPFAMEIVNFVEKIVDKVDALENRVRELESDLDKVRGK